MSDQKKAAHISGLYSIIGALIGLAGVLLGWYLYEESKDSKFIPKQTSHVTDLSGNTYKTIRLNDKIWLAENLNYEVSSSWWYNNNSENGTIYGRLYTWKAASKACKSLGRGWRLPTDEEWNGIAKMFDGANENDGSEKGVYAYHALIEGGNSGFNAFLGGYYDPYDLSFNELEELGTYWSRTSSPENSKEEALNYEFDSTGKLYRFSEEKKYGFSCRCIKN